LEYINKDYLNTTRGNFQHQFLSKLFTFPLKSKQLTSVTLGRSVNGSSRS